MEAAAAVAFEKSKLKAKAKGARKGKRRSKTLNALIMEQLQMGLGEDVQPEKEEGGEGVPDRPAPPATASSADKVSTSVC